MEKVTSIKNGFDNISRDKFVITCTSDETYFPHLYVLLKSLFQYNKSSVIIRGVHLSQDNIDNLNDINNVYVVDDKTPLCTKRTIMTRGIDGGHPRMKNLRSRLTSEHECYCTHSKFYNVDLLLNNGFNKILALDVDTIVRESLAELYDMIEVTDLIIEHKARLPNMFIPTNHLIFKEGLMVVKNTKYTRLFYRKISSTLKYQLFNCVKDFDIDSDHEVIGQVYDEMKDDICLSNLPLKFKDTTFDDNSVIWSGKGDRKFTNMKYISCFNQYISS